MGKGFPFTCFNNISSNYYFRSEARASSPPHAHTRLAANLGASWSQSCRKYWIQRLDGRKEAGEIWLEGRVKKIRKPIKPLRWTGGKWLIKQKRTGIKRQSWRTKRLSKKNEVQEQESQRGSLAAARQSEATASFIQEQAQIAAINKAQHWWPPALIPH